MPEHPISLVERQHRMLPLDRIEHSDHALRRLPDVLSPPPWYLHLRWHLEQATDTGRDQ